MTTIAYDGRYLAADSRVTNGNTLISDDAHKLVHQGGKFIASVGITPDIDKLIECVVGADTSHTNLDADCMYVDECVVYLAGCPDDGYWYCRAEFVRASGSGANFALAAMDLGKNAMEAINVAMNRDICTGGTIRYVDLSNISKGIQVYEREL